MNQFAQKSKNAWRDGELHSPFSGEPLRRDTAHSVSDGIRRFPLLEEIPFLRANREELIENALEKLDAGKAQEAAILLLSDQDDWARTDAPAAKDLEPLFEDENLNLRGAMRCLKYGAVADYFAFRWSDPTFLSGLKLFETHRSQNTKNVFELACGIGHFLREFEKRGIAATGADVVFSKLWLARKFLAPQAKLICVDANFNLPFADQTFEAAFCHDAFYFLPEKKQIAGELKRATRGVISLGHAHNRDAENFSSGAAISSAEYAALFENSVLYDDAELTAAFIENRLPVPGEIENLKKAEAVSLAFNAAMAANDFQELNEKKLRVNPLLFDAENRVCREPQYPSERYRDEYSALSGYLNLSADEADKLQSFEIEKLSETEIKEYTRRRILLDLPENW